MQQRLTITLWLLIAGGILNVLGSSLSIYLFQFMMALEHPLPDTLWFLMAFLSGATSIGLLSPFIVPKLPMLTVDRKVSRPTWGAFWGGLTGLLSSFVFAAINISMVSFGMKDGTVVFPLLINTVLLGIPNALTGAVVGGAGELFWRGRSRNLLSR